MVLGRCTSEYTGSGDQPTIRCVGKLFAGAAFFFEIQPKHLTLRGEITIIKSTAQRCAEIIFIKGAAF